MGNMMEMAIMDPLVKPFVAEGDVNGLLAAGLTVGGTNTGYAVAATQLATTAVDSGGTAIDASARPGFVDAKVVVTAISGGGATGPITGLTVAQAGEGYKVGDVVTINAGNATLTLVAGSLTTGGIVVTETTAAGVVSNAVYTLAQAKGTGAGAYVPSTDPNGTVKVSACANVVGAYVDTVFGNCSFDTRDHFNAEPERYRQSPYNQGNASSARIREIEMSDELLAAVDRTATYKAFYIQHSVPRFNNPSGVFDNDQYVYKIYAKCSDAADIAAVTDIMEGLEAWAAQNGNNVPYEDTNLYW